MAIDILEQMRVAFRTEAQDLLIELDSALLALEEQPLDSSLVNRVFRAIHTIKGSGATAGFTHLARFAHKMEEAFDLARGGRLAVNPDLINCGLKACDVLRCMIRRPRTELWSRESWRSPRRSPVCYRRPRNRPRSVSSRRSRQPRSVAPLKSFSNRTVKYSIPGLTR